MVVIIKQINTDLKKQYEIIYNNKKELLKHNFNIYFRQIVKSIEIEYDIQINSNNMFFNINKDFENSMNNIQSLPITAPEYEPELEPEPEQPEQPEQPEPEHEPEHKQEPESEPEPEPQEPEPEQQEPAQAHEPEPQQVVECETKSIKYSPTCLCYNKKKKELCGRPTKVGNFCGYHKDPAN